MATVTPYDFKKFKYSTSAAHLENVAENTLNAHTAEKAVNKSILNAMKMLYCKFAYPPAFVIAKFPERFFARPVDV